MSGSRDFDQVLASFAEVTADARRPALLQTHRRRPSIVSLLGAASVLVLVVALAIAVLGSPVAGPVGPTPTAPTVVDGLPVVTVGQVLEARAAGGLRTQSVAVGGYWSATRVAISCAAPIPYSTPGQLEMYCKDGLSGITELNEPIVVLGPDADTFARGPHLTPYLPSNIGGLDALYDLPWGYGQGHAPVPIVVVGHFDDPMAADCRPEAHQLCIDRLVVDKIAYFAPDRAVAPPSEPTLVPSPTPTAAVFSEHPTERPNGAQSACSAILDNIPMVIVKSGRATLAAAYEVNGAQLTTYFERILYKGQPSQSNGSDWWGRPEKIVDLCLFDGDLSTMTPGPPGADRSAARVLVVISDGSAQFWSSTRDKSTIPATDPATMS